MASRQYNWFVCLYIYQTHNHSLKFIIQLLHTLRAATSPRAGILRLPFKETQFAIVLEPAGRPGLKSWQTPCRWCRRSCCSSRQCSLCRLSWLAPRHRPRSLNFPSRTLTHSPAFRTVSPGRSGSPSKGPCRHSCCLSPLLAHWLRHPWQPRTEQACPNFGSHFVV